MQNRSQRMNTMGVKISIFALLCIGVRAEDSSGAAVWWMLFSLIALGAGTAYLVYLQYFEQKPLGKNNPYFEGEKVPESEKNKSRSQRRREEEDKEAYPGNKQKELEDKLRRDVRNNSRQPDQRNNNRGKPTSPNDVRFSQSLIYSSITVN